MLLKDRKRINNIPRFNIGLDAVDLFKLQFSINLPVYFSGGIGVTNNSSQAIGLQLQSGINNMSFMNTSASLMNQNTFNLLMKNSSNKTNTNGSSIAGAAISKTGNIIGNMFNQNQKFTDTASNNWKTIGDTILKEVPGAYGLAIGGGLNLISDYTGMRNYKISGSQMQNNSGTENALIGGINYIKQSLPDTYKAYKDVSNTATKNTIAMTGKGAATGAAAGSIIPGLGTVAGGIIGGITGLIGGLFGGSAARRRQMRINRNALLATNMINQELDAYASSEAILNKYYQNNNDTTDDILLANKGKDLNYNRRLNYRKLTKRRR